MAAHRWSPNDRNIGTINSPLAAGSAIEVDRLPVLVNHPRPLLHEGGAGGQLAHLTSGHTSEYMSQMLYAGQSARPSVTFLSDF